jgi:branched-chain amino acid transport system substrate-binding protein
MLRSERAARVVIVAALLLTACGGGGGSSSNAGAYQIGADVDLSGPFASIGKPNSDGMRAAVQGVNSRGGVGGHTINLVVRDDGAVTSRAITNTRELIDRYHSSAILGITSSAVGAAVAVIVGDAKVPTMGVAIGSGLLNPVQPYIFSTQPDYVAQGRAQADAVKQLASSGVVKQNPRVAMLGFASPAGTAWHDGFVKEASAVSAGTIVEYQGVPGTASDFTAQVARVVASKPDIIATFMFGGAIQTAANEMKAANIDPKTPIVSYSGTASIPFLKTFPWENFYTLFFTKDAHGGNNQTFKNLQTDAQNVGTDPDTAFFIDGYIEATLTMNAMKACGYPCTGTQLQKAMETTNTTLGGLAVGPIVWSPTYHYGITAGQFGKWNSAKGSVDFIGSAVDLKP